MPDRRNRLTLAILGLLLAAGGALSVCDGAGVFGTARANRDVFDRTVVRWWDEGGWESFAVVVAIGVIAAVFGAGLLRAQLRFHEGKDRTPTFSFPHTEGDRGQTSLRATALSNGLKADLEGLLDVHKAAVDMFGRYPDLEVHAVLDVGDSADFDAVTASVDQALSRVEATTGVRADPVRITVRFKDAAPERRLA